MIDVLSPGMLTTVQDLGRYGYGPRGVSASGAADPVALRVGNLLAGNPENTPALEMTLTGGAFGFPDGAIIARLAWQYIPSEENNKAFGQAQSFIARAPTNVQFMVKDLTKYASTGGWSFVQFNDGKLGDPAGFGDCFACHVPVKDRDYVFNRYSR